MTRALPVTVIGGYLGAGKTTLVNHLLRHSGRRLAVLVNEFGALPIDEDLIEAEGEDLISIAGGCVCCSFGDNLMGALQDLGQLDPAPEHVLVEASGVAIPSAIAANLSLLPEVLLSAVVVLADAETVQRHARDKYIGDTVLRQLGDADLVLLTKADLVPPERLGAVQTWLGGVTRSARVLPIRQGRLAPALLLDLPPTGVVPQAAEHGDLAFETLVLVPDPAVQAATLAERLTDPALGLVRAKGFAGGKLLQIVGPRWEVTEPAGAPPTGVVCIGLKGQIDRAALLGLAAGQRETGVR